MSQPPIPNLRDLAHASSPSLLHPNLILRSAIPPASPSAALTALNLSTVFDLRSGVEIEQATSGITDPSAPELWPAGPKRVHVPVFADADYGPEAIALRFKDYASADSTGGFVNAYRGILQSGGPAFGTVLRHLASGDDSQSGPVLIHCTAGKDRTGVLAALILALCGVPDEDIVADYGLTEEGLKDVKPGMVARLMALPSFKDDPEGADRMLSAKPTSMLWTLKMIREELGSVEDYVTKECGVSVENIARIRSRLLVDTASSPRPVL